MRTIFSLAILVGFSLALIGCRAIWNPTFLPSGYTYQTNPYKSAPGPKAPPIGYPYSAEKNAELMQVWRVVVQDLVAQMQEREALGPQEIYIKPLRQDTAFNTSYDHVLREVLREETYMLSGPSTPLHLSYEAHQPKDVTRSHSEMDKDSLKEFVLILSLVHDGVFVDKIAGVYKLPAYGYHSGKFDEGMSRAVPILGGGN